MKVAFKYGYTCVHIVYTYTRIYIYIERESGRDVYVITYLWPDMMIGVSRLLHMIIHVYMYMYMHIHLYVCIYTYSCAQAGIQ